VTVIVAAYNEQGGDLEVIERSVGGSR